MRLSTLIFNAFAIGRTRTFDVKNWAAVETARTAESRTTRVIIDVTPTTPSLFHSTSKKSNVKNAGGRRGASVEGLECRCPSPETDRRGRRLHVQLGSEQPRMRMAKDFSGLEGGTWLANK